MNILVTITVASLLAGAALALTRRLPVQNAALILGLLIGWEMALEAAWPGAGQPWVGWLFWPAVIVLARTGVRWLLRCWWQDRRYGFWLILLAGAAAALAQFSIALDSAGWGVALKLSAIRFAAVAFALFWLSPWFIAKSIQQPRFFQSPPR